MDGLTDKERRFCEEYDKTKNVFKSLRYCGIRLKTQNPLGYYVYFLCEKSTGNIFYVGKGKGRRMKDHLSKNNKCNYLKLGRIESILRNGGDIVTVVFKDNLSNDSALSLESELIQAIKGITNIIGNKRPKKELALERAKMILNGMIKPCELLYINVLNIDDKTTNYDIYNKNVQELKSIIRDSSEYIKYCM